jgi:hypothetical protein
MPALCSGLSLRSSPEHSASPSLYLVQQAATDGPELTATSGPRLLAKLNHCCIEENMALKDNQALIARSLLSPIDTNADLMARYEAHQEKLMAMRTDPNEELAKRFMEGLKAEADRLGSGLRENQQVLMYCYHGLEKLLVRSISMPSPNVVSMHCVDADDRDTHVTGHMHAVTFSFVVHTIVPPEVRRPIGFNMPSEES